MRKYNFIDVKNFITSVLDGGCSPFYCAAAAILIGRTELRAALLLFAALAGVISHSFDTHAQSKFFSTPSRGGAEGARAQAQITTFQNEIQRMNACTAAGLIFAPTHAHSDSGGCTSSGTARIFSDAVLIGGSAVVSGTLTIGDTVALARGLKLGDETTCNAQAEGTLRYVSAQKIVLLCNGDSWIELGASPATSGTFTPVTNAQLATTLTSNAIMVSGFFGTRTVSVSNGATIIVNGAIQGATASVQTGDMVALRMTSANSYNTARTTTLTLGSLMTGWTITTGSVSYGSWSAWSACSASCGDGTQTRTRSCQFSAGGAVSCSACGGDCSETQNCTGTNCCKPSGYSWSTVGNWCGWPNPTSNGAGQCCSGQAYYQHSYCGVDGGGPNTRTCY